MRWLLVLLISLAMIACGSEDAGEGVSEPATDIEATPLTSDRGPFVSITITNMTPGTSYDLVVVDPTGSETLYPRELVGSAEGIFHQNYSLLPEHPEGEYRIELRPEGTDEVITSETFTFNR